MAQYTPFKICIRCGKRKLKATQFYKNKTSPDGYRNTCKSCSALARKEKKKSETNPLFSEHVLSLMRHHKYIPIKKFGYFYGILIYLRPKEILAFSLISDTAGGSKIFETGVKAKEFLYKKMILAGDRTRAGLTKKKVF